MPQTSEMSKTEEQLVLFSMCVCIRAGGYCILKTFDIYCHGTRGSRNEETRILTNEVFNERQTERDRNTGKDIYDLDT